MKKREVRLRRPYCGRMDYANEASCAGSMKPQLRTGMTEVMYERDGVLCGGVNRRSHGPG